MKWTGVVRKIDDLGRVVIPKEIRKNLGIRDGESLEILTDESNIILTKKNIIDNCSNYISDIVYVAESIITGSIIITDREKVISSNDENIQVNDLLSNELTSFLDDRQSFVDNNLVEFIIGNKTLKGYFLIQPIISEGSVIGLIIIYNKDKQVSDYYLIVKFVSAMLARKLDISC